MKILFAHLTKFVKSLIPYLFIVMCIVDVFALWVFEKNIQHPAAWTLFITCLVVSALLCIAMIPMQMAKDKS